MLRIRFKGKEDKGHHKDGPRIYLRDDVVINGFRGVEEVVAPIYPSSASISKGGGFSEDDVEGSTTVMTRSRGTPASSCSRTGLTYWHSSSFYHCRFWS